VTFSVNGSQVGSATTDANGVATLSAVSLADERRKLSSFASFAGSDLYLSSSAQGVLTVQKANQSIAFSSAATAIATVGAGFPVEAGATSDSACHGGRSGRVLDQRNDGDPWQAARSLRHHGGSSGPTRTTIRAAGNADDDGDLRLHRVLQTCR